MLGPRTRSAAQRAPRAEQPEVQHNDNGNDDEREPKRTKRGERMHLHAPASASEQAAEAMAAAASHLYDLIRKHSCAYFLPVHLFFIFFNTLKHKNIHRAWLNLYQKC